MERQNKRDYVYENVNLLGLKKRVMENVELCKQSIDNGDTDLGLMMLGTLILKEFQKIMEGDMLLADDGNILDYGEKETKRH